MMDVTRHLDRLRAHHGTIAEVARRLGVSYNTAWRWYHTDRRPSRMAERIIEGEAERITPQTPS